MGAWHGGSWLGCGDLLAIGGSILSEDELDTVESPVHPRHPPVRQLVNAS